MTKIKRPPAGGSVLDVMLRRFHGVKQRVDELEGERKSLQKDLVGTYRSESIQKHTIPLSETENLTGTLVEQHRLTFDEDRLKKALGAETFNKYTKRVLDKEKIEAAISLGELDPNVVASCTEETVVEFIKVSKTKRRI